MIRSFLSVFSKGVRSPFSNRLLRPIHELAKSVGICTLVALSISPQAFAQTPAPDNYLAIVLDNNPSDPFYLNGIQKNDSAIFFGSRGGQAVRFTLTANGMRFLSLPLAGEPLSNGGTRPLVYASGYRGSTNLIAGYANRDDGAGNREAGQVWDMSDSTPVQTQLNVLTAPLFGITPGATVTAPYGADGNLVVGIGGPRQVNGQTNNRLIALAWEKTPNRFIAVDLHQVAGLPPNADSWANDVAGNVVVGSGGGGARRWDRNPATGAFTSQLIHPGALLGNNSVSFAADVDSGIIVGSGHGPNTGTNTDPKILSPYYRHALRWSGSEVTDLHQASGMNAYLGEKGMSFATHVSDNVSTGFASAPSFGAEAGGFTSGYARHAVRWNTSDSGVTSFLDLHTFLPPSTQTEYAPQTLARGVASDGTILGVAYGFPQLSSIGGFYGATSYLVWKPLAPNAGGVFDVTVPAGTTGYISKPFTQSGGSLSVGGNLSLNDGANGPVTYTVAGGQMSVSGAVNGSVLLTGGSVSGSGIVNGTVTHTGGTVIPGVAKGFQPVPFTISTYNQGRSGTLGVALRYENTLTFPPRTVLKANSLKTNRAILNGALLISPPKQIPVPVGSQVVVLTTQNLVGGFTSVTPGWRLTYTGSPLYGQRSVVATYIGDGTPPRQ